MMVIRVYGAREGVRQPLLVIDLLQFWMCSIYTFQHGFGRTTGEGHTLKVQAYTAARYTPSVICPIPSICFRHDTTLQFEYTLLLRLTLCSPDTDKPSFIHNLKHHSQKPNCFKSSHINVLKKIVNTFSKHHLSRNYFRTPETSLSHFFPDCPRDKCYEMMLLHISLGSAMPEILTGECKDASGRGSASLRKAIVTSAFIFFSVALRTNAGYGLLILEVS